MRGGDWHTGVTCHADRHRRRQLRRQALCVGHAFLTDLLTNGGRNALPANHGTQRQRQCYRDDDPDRSIFDGLKNVGFQFAEEAFVRRRSFRQLRHFIGRIRHTHQQATHMAAFIRCQGAVRRQIGQQRLRAADII